MDFATLDRGLALFNQQRYFDAHEVWEHAWLDAEGCDKLFLQCLIQTAAALLHAARGNTRGAESVWGKACANLGGLPGRYAGVDLVELRAAVANRLARGATLEPAPRLRREFV